MIKMQNRFINQNTVEKSYAKEYDSKPTPAYGVSERLAASRKAAEERRAFAAKLTAKPARRK